MRIFSGLLTGLLGLAVLLTGCGEGDSDSDFSLSSSEPLVSVALQKENEIIIDILDNDLQIQDIVVNRGNCFVTIRDSIKYTGKFSNVDYRVIKGYYPDEKSAKTQIYFDSCYPFNFTTNVKAYGYRVCNHDYQKWEKILKEHNNDFAAAYLAYAEAEFKQEADAPEDFMKLIKEGLEELQEMETFAMNQLKKPKLTYQFGDQFFADVWSGISYCNIREVVIKTNKGNWGFEWGQH